jgi:carboxypeptidase T
MILALFLLAFDPRYHTHAAMMRELDSLARSHPSIMMLDTIGLTTRDSLAIPAVKISDHPRLDEDEPAVLFVGNHHAEEILGVEIGMYMINDLISNYGHDSAKTYWIDNREIWIVPMLNADGNGVVVSGLDTIWRKNKRDNNLNGVFDLDYDGVDLNRNYDFHWDYGGSMDPGSENYRGSEPFSENETRAIRNLSYAENFVFAISYHSARTGIGEVLYYPWSDPSGYPPDITFIRQVADSTAKRIVNDAGNGHYWALIGVGLDGMTRNWLYGVRGTIAFDIEVSRSCQPPGLKVDSICLRNLPGAYYLLSRAGLAGITGTILDTLTGQPLIAEVIIEGYYDPELPARTSDPQFGRFLRIVTPGTYDLTLRKAGYVPKKLTGVKVETDAMTRMTIFMNPMEHESGMIQSPGIIIQPNPAGKSIIFNLGRGFLPMDLKIYDINGRLIKKFHVESRIEQLLNYIFIWDTIDDHGRGVPNGVYVAVGSTSIQKFSSKFVIND